jgi:two-component system, chemotaxis family, sensor kinase Cph1
MKNILQSIKFNIYGFYMVFEDKKKLRKKAELELSNQLEHPDQKSDSNKDELIHELRVHQVELEIQNEELREAQCKLEDSQHKYFDLYNFAPDGYFTLNKDGIILEVNLAGATLLGEGRKDLYESAFIRFIDPDYRNNFHHHLLNFSEDPNIKQTLEIKLIKSDKTSFYANLEIMNIRDSNGNFKEYRIAVTDISALKNTEEALKESEERYREIFVNNPAAMILVDLTTGNIIDANPAASSFYGYDLDNLIKMKISDINVYDGILEEMQMAGSTQKNRLILEHRLSNGKIRNVDVQSGLIGDKNENVLCSIIQDITAQKNAENALADHNASISEKLNIEKNYHESAEIRLEELTTTLEISNRALEQFAYVSSHDLREPLRMITSFLQLLKKRYENDLDEDAHDFINYAVEGAKRLDMMLNDLLEYSKIGIQESQMKYLHSEKIVEQALNNLKTQIQNNNAEITYDSLPIIYANEYQMIQLFQNLISNGIKFHGENDPNIHISVKKKDEEYVFAVKDNGIGIKEQHLKKIFTIFQRLNQRQQYNGSGIGLAITQRIIQEHGGIMWATSNSGRGSTFYFTIPIKNEKK